MFLAGPFDLEKDTKLREMFEVEDALLFGERADVHTDFRTDTFADLLRKIPQGKEVEFLLFYIPEFFVVPLGIENAPFPVIGVISDWSVNLEALTKIAPFFSYLIVDHPGVKVFQDLGFSNVATVPLYGFTPSLFKRDKNAKKNYDVTMVGNLNHVVQQQRSSYLHRLVQLSSRHTIKILSGVFGEDYVQVLNASKITFNCSIRGEMNMRCYEALACGSLLFLEEENQEAKFFLKDKIHCVYYNQENFEELIEYFLIHEEERQKITNAGYEWIQDFSYKKQFKRLLCKVREINIQTKPPAYFWSETQKAKNRIFHSLHSSDVFRFRAAIQNKPCLDSSESDSQFLSGFISLECSDSCEGELKEQLLRDALNWFDKSIPESKLLPIVYYNKGQALVKLGRQQEAFDFFLKALYEAKVWDFKSEFQHLLNPITYDAWKLEKEKRMWQGKADSSALFLSKCWNALGDAYVLSHLFEKGKKAYEEALKLGMGEVEILCKLARTLEKLKDIAGAVSAWELALAKISFLPEAWQALPRLYFALGATDKLATFCQEVTQIIDTCPIYEPFRGEIENWMEMSIP